MAKRTPQSLAPLTARAASGVGDAVEVGPDTTLDLLLAVTAIAGTLTVAVETSPDLLNWTPIAPQLGDDADEQDGAFPVATTAATTARVFPDAKRYVRARWTLSAGGSATFSVTGHSIRVYAMPSDMPALGIRSPWLESINARKIDIALRSQTDNVTDAFASAPGNPFGHLLPFSAWGDNIREGCCACAAVSLMATEGTRPDAEDEKMLIERCKKFDAWLALVAAGKRGQGELDEDGDGEIDGGATVILTDDCRWNF
jgi:hypothetical protein